MTAWWIVTDSPWRYPAQALVSTGQFYGLILYFATNALELNYEGIEYSRPEAYYWWAYYFLLNAPWLVVPPCKSIVLEISAPSEIGGLPVVSDCIWISAKETANAFTKVKQSGTKAKANGVTKN